MRTTAVLYARYSTDRQSEASIQDQLRTCRAYASEHGWQVASEHVDEGISGAALGNRPGVQAALAAVHSAAVLVVSDLSRLSRSQDLAPLLSRLRHRGVRVVGVQDGFDSDSRTARMQAGLSGIMSEEFRAMVADRTRSALELRALSGQPTGGKAYDDHVIVQEIFHRFAGGESMKAIASDLNRRGVPSPGATWKARSSPRGRWLVSALHAILKNERYIGRLVWNRSQWIKDPDTGKRARRERPTSEWIVKSCEAVIDEDTWARVQARFRPRGGRGGAPRYLLSGLLECGICGSKLVCVGGSQHRYVCGAHHAGGEHACSNGHTVPRLIAEEHILRPVLDDMLSPSAIADGVKFLREERAKSEHRPSPISRELVELERMVREGLLSPEVAAPAIAEARRRQKAIEAGMASELPWPTEKAWRETVAAMRDVLTGDDIPAARTALRELIGTVRCVPAGEHVLAELTARQVLLATGTGRWVGSGGALCIYLPRTSRRTTKTVP